MQYELNGDIDTSAATDGTYIATTSDGSDVTIFDFAGNVLFQTTRDNFFCAASLPVCKTSGFPGDARVTYDPASSRWIYNALWVDASETEPPTSILMISENSNPTGPFYAYQYSDCFLYSKDEPDQPHVGFNGLWITVTTECPNGYGLMVFPKNLVYRGTFGAFMFKDIYDEGTTKRDNPARSYQTTYNNREYLTEADIDDASGGFGFPRFNYSYIDGSQMNPAYHENVFGVTVGSDSERAGIITQGSLISPGCSSPCIPFESQSYVHSSGVYSYGPDLDALIVANAVFSDANYQSSTQVVNLAVDEETGGAAALAIYGAAGGSGPMASNIAMPAFQQPDDVAIFGYDASRSNMYPGYVYGEWDLDNGNLNFLNLGHAGYGTPTFPGPDPRWVDFDDAASYIPNSTQVLSGGTYSVGATSPAQRNAFIIVNP